MKKCLALLLFASLAITGRASHITGGEMFYTFTGIVGGQYTYSVTLKLYQRCNSGRQFPNPAIISIFDKTTSIRVTDLSVGIGNTENISLTNPGSCITNPPFVCYDVAYYSFQVSLPSSVGGYVLASQVNFRINGINNLSGGQIGATYTADIPGTSVNPSTAENNSAHFVGSDLVVICADNNFAYSFAAVDGDFDELRYSFCSAYASTGGSGGTATPTGPPPFPQVPYGGNFSGDAPLGVNVQVNPQTGLITGTAPASGFYVVTVCVEEIRNGQVIAVQRKDVQINIAECDIAAASLLPEYQLCRDTRTITVQNQSTSPLIVTQGWQVFDRSGNLIYTLQNGAALNYTFPDTGIYFIKLVINANLACSDSTTSLVRVYPGFIPSFSSIGICHTKQTRFTDQTTSVYGIVNSWSWDFGEAATNTDVSQLQNPVYTYPTMGTKQIVLTVTDSKGCRDTATRSIDIIDKPPISLSFRDTLICVGDRVQLLASGNGQFNWTPASNINNSSIPDPIVFPSVTTIYYVDLDESGCRNKDSVKVKVVDHVTIRAMADTSICSGDTIQLRIDSDGFGYSWSPASQVIDPTLQDAVVFTPQTTTYRVVATIGGCNASATINVRAVPYPRVNAGVDSSICYNTLATLHGTTDGKSWSWSPAASVRNPQNLISQAYPASTMSYTLTAFDTRGCPKPGRDTVIITVFPKMNVSAGRDSALVIGQPMQFHATGAETYQWSPPFYLSSPDIPDPIGLFSEPETNLRFKVVGANSLGCLDSAYITIKIYATAPTIFIPSAFTPNNDGKNDILRPLAAGMGKIEFFKIFNRWGELVYQTNINGQGWDGKINGQVQATNTYTWIVKATDYSGRPYFQKGVVTLIR